MYEHKVKKMMVRLFRSKSVCLAGILSTPQLYQADSQPDISKPGVSLMLKSPKNGVNDLWFFCDHFYKQGNWIFWKEPVEKWDFPYCL